MNLHNPQAVVNGFFSGSRNIFLTTTVGVAMYGFSSTFKLETSDSFVKIMSILVFIVAFTYGLNIVIYFHKFIKMVEQNKNSKDIQDYIDINYMKNALYITGFFVLILLVVIILTIIRLYNRII